MPKSKKQPEGASAKRLTTKQVIALSRKYLEPHQPSDYRLQVIEDGVQKDGDWWHVLVQPSRDDIRSYDYYGRLAEAEISLRDAENVNILLVPVLPA